jgi:hypothetical protein
MGLCANKFFLRPLKMRLEIHFYSKSRSVKILWYKNQFQIDWS